MLWEEDFFLKLLFQLLEYQVNAKYFQRHLRRQEVYVFYKFGFQLASLMQNIIESQC